MRNFVLACFAMLMISGSGCVSKISPDEERLALESAKAWLALMDAEAYAAGWREAAVFLQESVPENEWVQTMRAVRKPMGSPISRNVKSIEFRSMRPKALKGKYLIIDYQSSFANRPSVAESITQMMQNDGVWRVAGYHLE